MEKCRSRLYKLICNRLLILLFIFSTEIVFCQNYGNLRITPENEYCFTGDPTVFNLFIPNVKPSEVETTVQSTPTNVSIISTSKSEFIENDIRGTRVSLVFKFTKSGTYKIPSISARIRWSWVYIPFKSITVYDNPFTLLPIITSTIPDTLYAGEKTFFTISAHYFSEFTDISSVLDPHMLLERTKLFNSLPYYVGGFSTTIYDLAEYAITPLEEGNFTIPEIKITFRTYASNLVSIRMPSKTVKVLPSVKNSNSNKFSTGSSFKNSFDKDINDFETESDLSQNKEYGTLFNPEEIANTVLKQEVWKRNCLRVCIIAFGFLFLLFSISLVLGLVFKNKRMKILSIILMCLFGILFILCCVFLTPKYAITLGGTVRIVPEMESNTVMQLSAGAVVQITSKSTDWFCVSTSDNRSGWILRSECIEVE